MTARIRLMLLLAGTIAPVATGQEITGEITVETQAKMWPGGSVAVEGAIRVEDTGLKFFAGPLAPKPGTPPAAPKVNFDARQGQLLLTDNPGWILVSEGKLNLKTDRVATQFSPGGNWPQSLAMLDLPGTDLALPTTLFRVVPVPGQTLEFKYAVTHHPTSVPAIALSEPAIVALTLHPDSRALLDHRLLPLSSFEVSPRNRTIERHWTWLRNTVEQLEPGALQQTVTAPSAEIIGVITGPYSAEYPVVLTPTERVTFPTEYGRITKPDGCTKLLYGPRPGAPEFGHIELPINSGLTTPADVYLHGGWVFVGLGVSVGTEGVRSTLGTSFRPSVSQLVNSTIVSVEGSGANKVTHIYALTPGGVEKKVRVILKDGTLFERRVSEDTWYRVDSSGNIDPRGAVAADPAATAFVQHVKGQAAAAHPCP